MNICIVNFRENNPYIGGVERVSHQLGHYWHKQGQRVIFLSQLKTNLYKSYNSECAEYFLPESQTANTESNLNYAVNVLKDNRVDVVINQCSVFEGLCSLCAEIKKRYPVLLITTIHYAPLCRIAEIENSFFIRAKLGHNIRLWIVDTLLYLRYHLIKKNTLLSNERMALHKIAEQSDAVVLLSNAFKSEMIKVIGETYQDKLIIIPNPIDSKHIEDNAGKRKQIVYVGRLEFGMKRFDRLIRIWAKIEAEYPDWCFRVIGDGQVRPVFEHMVRGYGLKHMYFEGFRNPEKYYAESDILCLSSSTEGFGMVLAEALQHQCIPVAYHSFSSIDDIIINNVNGYTITPFDEKEYIRKLKYLMANGEERNRLAFNHAVTLGKFRIDVVSKQWMDLFNSRSK